MRFIHAGDINIGAKPDSDKRWGKERAEEFKDTLKKVVDKAKEIDCDLLLISGNLFCHQPVTKELYDINLLFSTIPATRVIITAGSSDRLRKNSSVLDFKWSSNVSFVLSESYDRINIPSLHTVVYAISLREGGSDISELVKEIKAEAKKDSGYTDILMFFNERHGDEAYERELTELIGAQSFSYTALGGAESFRELERGRIAYPGFLTAMDMHTTGEHGVIVGDISSATGKMIGLEFVKLADTCYIPISVEINERVKANELRERLEAEMDKRGRNNIYKLRVTGKRAPEEEPELEALRDRFKIVEISDETEPQYDFSKLFSEHPDDIIGFYISSVMKNGDEEKGSLERRAMHYAVDALLATERKRSQS